MFLHLGGTTIIDMDKVIAVLDLETIPFEDGELEKSIFGGKIENISEGEPKTLVITDDRIILSHISALTLQKRNDSILT